MEGKVLIFSAPSGAGKTTVVKHILQQFSGLEFSISATTRPCRENETEGKDYFFMSEEGFRKRISSGDFIEYEEVYPGRFYGTLRSEIERIWQKGSHVVFDVDVKGGINLKNIFKNKALSVFISPPDIDTLEDRLRKRGTETPETLVIRVNKAKEEMTFAQQFDLILKNDKLEETLVKAEKIVSGFINSKS